MKSILSYRGACINAKRFLYEGVIMPTDLYGSVTWGIRRAARRVNVLEK